MEKPKILIVEDNKINALVLKKAIIHISTPTHVINDKTAFEALEQQTFDLILMDINLGGNSLDGEAIMKILKKDPKYQDTPIFAVTSYALPEDRVRFLEAGFDGFYPKPIDKIAIVEGIQSALMKLAD